jgi:hypothetical protein
MLIAPFIVILLALQPQVGPAGQGKDEISKWKPGPKVSQELARLDREGRQMYSLFRDGKLAQLTLIRELARVKTTMEALRAWSFANHSDEVPLLVVVIDSEYLQVFPRGTRHLPGELVAGEIYPATAQGPKQWQYLGERRVTGMRVAVFRYASEEMAAPTSPRIEDGRALLERLRQD